MPQPMVRTTIREGRYRSTTIPRAAHYSRRGEAVDCGLALLLPVGGCVPWDPENLRRIRAACPSRCHVAEEASGPVRAPLGRARFLARPPTETSSEVEAFHVKRGLSPATREERFGAHSERVPYGRHRPRITAEVGLEEAILEMIGDRQAGLAVIAYMGEADEGRAQGSCGAGTTHL